MLTNGTIENYIADEYAAIAKRREEAAEERRTTVYTLIPEIEEIDRDIAMIGVNFSSRIINTSATAEEIAAAMEKELSSLKRKRADILKKHNMSEDVFDVPYECSVCKDTGIFQGEKCVCYKQKIKKFVMDAARSISNIPVDFESKSFRSVDFSFYSKEVDSSIGVSPYDNARNIYKTCLNFCKNFGKSYENLYIYGPAGVGKTHLTSCIVGELVNSGHSVIYQTAYKLFEFLEDCKFNRSNQSDAPLVKNAVYDCDLLIIDDFGTEFITSYTQTVLFDLLNTRLLEKKPTIINSNLNLRDVSATYTDRISSRIMGEYTLLRFVGQDIRLLKKQREE